MNIIEALKELDVLNDDHWTADGAPKIDAVASQIDDFKINRKDIIEAAPHFDRKHPFEDETTDDSEDREAEATDDSEDKEAEAEATDEIYHGGNAVVEFAKHLKTIKKDDASDFIEEVRQELIRVHQDLEDAQIRARATKKMLDLAKAHAQTVNPEITNGQAIRGYIDSQNKARAERAEKRDRLFKGITMKDIKEITGKSPLDQAMSARKPTRGSVRPQRM